MYFTGAELPAKPNSKIIHEIVVDAFAGHPLVKPGARIAHCEVAVPVDFGNPSDCPG